MPITYEPPQPVVPDISRGYGALQQENIDWDRQYKLAALQAQLTAANLHAHGGGGGGAGFGGMHGDQGSALNPGRPYESPLGLQQNAANLGMQQQAQTFSQAEALHLQRLQQADSYLNQQLTDGNLTPDEVRDSQQRIRGMVGVLTQRQQQAQTQRIQQQTQLEQQQAARQASIERINEEYRRQPALHQDNDAEIEEQVRGEYRQQFGEGAETLENAARSGYPDAAGWAQEQGWNETDIQQEINRRGGRRTWFQDRPGHRALVQGGTVGGQGRSRQAEEREANQRDVETHMAHWRQHYQHVETVVNARQDLQGSEHNQDRRNLINTMMQGAGFAATYPEEEARLRQGTGANREAQRRATWAQDATRRPGEPRVPANTPPERQQEIARAVSNRRLVEDWLRRTGDRRTPEDLAQEEIDRLLGRNQPSAQPAAAGRIRLRAGVPVSE